MRMSVLFLRTLREDPADAEVDSHRLLLRAGYIRRVATGLYSWLPLGARVMRKVSEIVRQEMDQAGAQEVSLPIAQPLELWDRTGRNALYGELMFRLTDRKDSAYCLSPTAEEVITTLVAQEYGSYRDLPVNLYQINWKYRDEIRPRFGLLRSREFLMKDAYSFDLDAAGQRESYGRMYDAYHRIFERCGLTFRPVEAQSGEMGGDVNHEFMAVAAVGEDDFVWCKACDYAANVEAARRQPPNEPDAAVPPSDIAPRDKVHTPDLGAITAVSKFLQVAPNEMLKCIVFDVDGELGLAIVPGDREVNEFALAAALAPKHVGLFTDADFEAHPELAKGYIGPDFPGAVVVVADPADRGAHRLGHRRQRGRLSRAQRGARPRLPRRRVGRPRDDRVGRPLPTMSRAAFGRPGNRGRARLPDRHQVLGGVRRELHRRARRPASYGHGLLRDRRDARRRRDRRGAPRRARHLLADRAGTVRRAPGGRTGPWRTGRRGVLAGRAHLRGAQRGAVSTCSTTIETPAPE